MKTILNPKEALPDGAANSHRLLPESGVIVVSVKQAFRAQDFDSLAFTADAWIEAHSMEIEQVPIALFKSAIDRNS